MTQLLILVTLLVAYTTLVQAYSKPIPTENNEKLRFRFNSNITKHALRHDESSELNNVKDTEPLTTESLFEIGKTIKPQDFAVWSLFTGFIDRYNRVYKDKREVLKRFRIYKHNTRAAKMWQDNDQGTAVYGETRFFDLTPTEFRQIYLPYKWQAPEKKPNTLSKLEISQLAKPPESVDWRKKQAVTPVKDQGQCGSCWAFSVTGNIEGQWAVSKGKLQSLSEQELMDCDLKDYGCDGGLPLNAYDEIIRLGGLETEKEYPYEEYKEKSCKLVKKDITAYINSSVQLPQDEEAMAAYLAEKGPISIGVNANPLQFYRHGISHPFKVFCSPLSLDHGVLIVGYGKEGNKPYWIIKNSWGPAWGEEGYYRLYRGQNVCGVNEMATTSIIN